MLELIVTIIVCVAVGAMLGLVPLLLGRYFYKPGLGKLGMLCSALSGIFAPWLGFIPVLVALGFSVAIFIARTDFAWPESQPRQPAPQYSQYRATGPAGGGAAGALNVICLSGPLRGQVYRIGSQGLRFGRDNTCAVRLPDNTPGVSRQHCAVRWQQGVPVLVDLGSSHGTFLGNGQKLPPQYPVEIAAGTRFYLGDTNCMFQITVA